MTVLRMRDVGITGRQNQNKKAGAIIAPALKFKINSIS
jgi:hypothetical protein